ncbi:META domain-containing protein [Thalassospira sp.]|uniref:META domain-containing protein n=1 Tax=Thalassospira sp. TaxID=1912094 RepID=UPI0025FED9FA|nr:META domain-containing protein [Thalassospira sp.]|tara:strand:- start:2194 stop:2652 length:459 start_codon:yes stop_codon:yes gene_type:complete
MHRAKHAIVSSVALASSLLLAACSATSTSTMNTPWSDVAGQEWHLVQVKDGNGTLSPTETAMATATFSADGMVSGNAGCNQYSGGYEQSGASLGVAQLAMTRKFCIAEEAMRIESAFSGALVLVNSWDMVDGNLVLKDSAGNVVIELTSTAP